MANGFGEEIEHKPVTLPRVTCPQIDDDAERRELAAHLAEQRIIRAGRDAWEQIAQAQSFTAWVAIGRALSVGKQYALRVTGANSVRSRRYCLAFSRWMRDHGFGDMTASVRSVAIELHENLAAIEAWRGTLPERQRRRLIHPLSNVRRWQAATQPQGKSVNDWRRDAKAAFVKLLVCLDHLPPSDVAILWAMARKRMANHGMATG